MVEVVEASLVVGGSLVWVRDPGRVGLVPVRVSWVLEGRGAGLMVEVVSLARVGVDGTGDPRGKSESEAGTVEEVISD